ncbi:hypothetical protein [Bradyrhizobium sp. SZCCHNR3118]|uniref:hypothetical protein n=1 Tax=Bradyrhizobium sp. SZCCHNR3118 TaxID=3057468 RepID=UPI0029162E55|nr:hypothetical protein [Bradyrhizobium sp. SZCCHNR3118]
MTKTLTPMQERMLGRVIAFHAQTLYLREGQVNSVRNLIKKGIVDEHCYLSIHYGQITPLGRDTFFGENDPVFAVEDPYDHCWLVFEDREMIAAPRSQESADRIVKALMHLRQEERQAQKIAA